MFLPWKDENPSSGFAWVTVGLLAVNVVAFLLELRDPSLVSSHGLVPARLLARPAESAHALVTSLFLHGSVLHLASNLLYLWIFGDNVEDALGSGRFLLFYVACGLGAHAAHVGMHVSSEIPTVGASGAIAGVLAAYLLRYPSARIRTFLYLVFLVGNFRVPAAVVIGVWFLLQVLGGLGSLGGQGGGIAWFEHLGGFAAGAVLFPVLQPRRGRRRR